MRAEPSPPPSRRHRHNRRSSKSQPLHTYIYRNARVLRFVSSFTTTRISPERNRSPPPASSPTNNKKKPPQRSPRKKNRAESPSRFCLFKSNRREFTWENIERTAIPRARPVRDSKETQAKRATTKASRCCDTGTPPAVLPPSADRQGSKAAALGFEILVCTGSARTPTAVSE